MSVRLKGLSVYLKRPSLRFTCCNYGFIYMRGGCVLTVHSCGMTVQCCADAPQARQHVQICT